MPSSLDPLDGLDDEQRAVAEAVEGPVVVLAGAGTGKTRAITHRIANAAACGAQHPANALAVTFTTRAAGEMRARLARLGVEGAQVRTFHAAALSQLRYFWPQIAGGDFPELLPSKARLIAEAAGRAGLGTQPALVRDLSSDIEWCKAVELPLDTIATDLRGAARPWAADRAQVAAVAEAYEQIKARRGLLDFEDILLVLVGAMERDPAIADRIRATYRWFTVDEYQDVNPLQQHLLSLWLGDRDDLCVVGDPNQTIYGFTGASPRYLREFATLHPQAVEVRLVNCYRSTPQIVGAANSVAGPGGVRLRALRPDGPAPTLQEHADDVAEARAVATRIAQYLEAGVPAREIAVLFRVNAQSEELEAALAAHGIAVNLRGTERFFDRPEVKEALTRLRGAALAATGELGAEVRAALSAAGWTEQPPAAGAQRERWESLAALVALAEEFAVQEGDQTPLRQFILELETRQRAQHAPQPDGVTLASLHAAKGQEWDVVFIVGCSEGLLPLSYATSDEGVAEEQRLCYVGITRARTHLHLSWAASRQPGGRASREPSRFLRSLAGADGEPAPSSVRGSVRGRKPERRGRTGPASCRGCGKALVTGRERTIGRCRTCPGSANEQLVERLRQWRLALSRDQGVPAYVICTDATLEAVAERRPADLEQLADIPGIGPAKLERYGAELLSLLDGVPGNPPLELLADAHGGAELAQHPDTPQPHPVDEGV